MQCHAVSCPVHNHAAFMRDYGGLIKIPTKISVKCGFLAEMHTFAQLARKGRKTRRAAHTTPSGYKSIDADMLASRKLTILVI